MDDLKPRGVKLRSLTEAIDTDTPTGRVMWQLIGVRAELEHGLIAERTTAGVAATRARRVKFGRKWKLTRQQVLQARKFAAQGERPEDLAASFRVGARAFIGASHSLRRM